MLFLIFIFINNKDVNWSILIHGLGQIIYEMSYAENGDKNKIRILYNSASSYTDL